MYGFIYNRDLLFLLSFFWKILFVLFCRWFLVLWQIVTKLCAKRKRNVQSISVLATLPLVTMLPTTAIIVIIGIRTHELRFLMFLISRSFRIVFLPFFHFFLRLLRCSEQKYTPKKWTKIFSNSLWHDKKEKFFFRFVQVYIPTQFQRCSSTSSSLFVVAYLCMCMYFLVFSIIFCRFFLLWILFWFTLLSVSISIISFPPLACSVATEICTLSP